MRLIEDAHFKANFKTGVKNFYPTLGATLIEDFSGNHNKKFKSIDHFLPFLKTVTSYDRTSKRMSFWAITSRFRQAQQDKIGSEMRANLYALNKSLT